MIRHSRRTLDPTFHHKLHSDTLLLRLRQHMLHRATHILHGHTDWKVSLEKSFDRAKNHSSYIVMHDTRHTDETCITELNNLKLLQQSQQQAVKQFSHMKSNNSIQSSFALPQQFTVAYIKVT